MAFNVSLSSLNSIQRGLTKTNSLLARGFERQASGKRINRAADDAAGLAISEKLSSDLKALAQASKNISTGSNLLRTAEGGLSQINNMLERGRELAIQASNGTLSDSQRSTINREFNQIKKEINRQTATTEFNGQKLLTGDLGSSSSNPIAIQAGIENSENDRVTIDAVESTNTSNLGLDDTDLSTADSARSAISDLAGAIQQVVDSRSGIGALENRLESAVSNVAVAAENLVAAESQIRGADYAKEASDQKRNEVLQQAGISSLSEGLKQAEKLIGSLLNTKG